MQKTKQIHIFGYFGFVTNQLDGQTVKTRAIYKLIKSKVRPNVNVSFSDSQSFRSKPQNILSFLLKSSKCSTLIWLPAQNNLKYLFPLIWVWSKIWRFNIIYVVIGGWLSSILNQLPFHRKKLKKIKAILLENELSKNELFNQYHFNNLDIIPNFREITPCPQITADSECLKIVFMARVNRRKGLDTIAQIAHNLNNKNIILDIYGPVNGADKVYFETQLLEPFPFIHYCGILNPDQIYTTLSKYDVMIFPTHYYTEGFPGSIMDAYRSGIPIIATNWKHAKEFITNGETGFIVDFDHPDLEMCSYIERLRNDTDLLIHMKRKAYEESLKYTPEKAWGILKKYLE